MANIITSEKPDDQSNQNGGSILARKLRKVLDSQLETDLETQDALRELSTFFTENTLRNRRNLRGEIERQSLNNHLEFLRKFETVKIAIDEIYGDVRLMTSSCNAMQKQLEMTRTKAHDLISQTSALQNRTTVLERRSKMVNEFLTRYQLPTDEVLLLMGRSSTSTAAAFEIKENFFVALDHAQTISRDCRTSLLPTAETTALEVMDQMTQYIDAGLQRLYRWTQAQCRTFDVATSSAETSALVAKAMAHLLADRPALFRLALDDYCSGRRSGLARAFIDALTVGGPGGTPRPIEWHAHDPQRYVGDMLAWLHQATPTESENIRALLKLCPESSQDWDKEATCEEVLSNITEGVCRPLRNRVEQILLSQHGAVILYRLTNLIRFYGNTIKQVISTNKSTLIETLDDLDQLAYNQFMSILNATVQQQTTGSSLVGKTEATAHDLTPSPSVIGLLSLLRDILSSTSVLDEHPAQLEEIISTVIEPLIQSLSIAAGSFSTTDQDVFLLNSFYQIHSILSVFKGNDLRLASLASEMQLHLDTLSSEQTSNLIANLGFQPICTMISSSGSSGKVPLSQMSGMEPASLQRFLDKFDNFLVAPDMFLLPQTRLLTSSAHRKNITKRSLEVIAASYKQLFDAVNDPSSGYPQNLMTKSPKQVDALLQL